LTEADGIVLLLSVVFEKDPPVLLGASKAPNLTRFHKVRKSQSPHSTVVELEVARRCYAPPEMNTKEANLAVDRPCLEEVGLRDPRTSPFCLGRFGTLSAMTATPNYAL